MINSTIYCFVAATASRWSRRWRHGGGFWGRRGLLSQAILDRTVFWTPPAPGDVFRGFLVPYRRYDYFSSKNIQPRPFATTRNCWA